MKHLTTILGFVATIVAGAPVPDDQCGVVVVTVYADESPISQPVSSAAAAAATIYPYGSQRVYSNTSTTPIATVYPSGSATSIPIVPANTISAEPATSPAADLGTGTVSAVGPIGTDPSNPGAGFKKVSCTAGGTSPVGPASFPINGDNLCAPEASSPVPQNAAIYTPSHAGQFDLFDFQTWLDSKQKAGATYVKITPGLYAWGLGPEHSSSTDTNTVFGENIVITTGNLVFDLRDVTFVIEVTPGNSDQRPGEMIYVGYCDNVTILGGTIWIDQGELWSYAEMKSMDANMVATFQIPEGYNRSAWLTPGGRPLGGVWCVDTNDANHYSFGLCNQWAQATVWDNSKTLSDGIVVVTSPGWGETKSMIPNFALSTPVGPQTPTTIGAEAAGSLVIKGMTTNGNFWQYGLRGKPTAILEDCWIVQPPPRPGYGGVGGHGPIWFQDSLGHINFNAPGEEAMTCQNSFWQTSSNPFDLQDMNNSTVPLA